MKTKKQYYVVIPVHNESRHIRGLLKRVSDYTKSIIVVDDGSTDKTAHYVKEFSYVVLISLAQNGGKGLAMKIGAEKAFQLGAGAVVFIDGDNQHNPKHLPKFFELLDCGVSIIIGIRILKAAVPIHRKLGNQLGILFLQKLFNISVADLLCGYRALSKKGYKAVKWSSSDYGVETEMITIIARKKLAYHTVVVDTIYLDKYKGFSLSDGVKIIMKLPYWRLRKL